MGKSKKSRTKKPVETAPLETPQPTCEIFGCDCKLVYVCETCEKRVCAAHFLGMEGLVMYHEALPLIVCAKCPFCKQMNPIADLCGRAERDKLKLSLGEFTKSNGDIEFVLVASEKESRPIGSVTLQWHPCSSGGCCTGKLHFDLESKCKL